MKTEAKQMNFAVSKDLRNMIYLVGGIMLWELPLVNTSDEALLVSFFDNGD
ncbi:unnamed protein product [Dovyalis caffra]|uniref:Uncharacterized protein n=1 Tax=Dovyalis caffra TaxID=77055 RepID=A0AAV1RAB6_9ROSI|nr:unnamed protein product [Dovyalis caffra]